MNYVYDSSVALKCVLPEADSEKALRLRDDYLNGIHELMAPDIFPTEVANALATAERQGRIQQGEAAQFLFRVVKCSPLLHEATPLLLRAQEISIDTRQAVYDCLYVALAEQAGCEMVTADMALIKNLGAKFPFIRSLSSMP